MSSSKSTVNVNTKMAKKSAVSPVTETTPSTTAPVARKTKTTAKAEVTVPVTSSTDASSTPVPVAAPVSDVRSTDAILTSIQEQLKALGAEVTTKVRALVAESLAATKALKREARSSKHRRRKDVADMTPEEKATWEARRANNAFLKLRPITDELASFMGMPAKSEQSQTQVTKFVSQYVKAHNCFDPKFKRRILPDAKLAKLLRVKDDQEVTYLNLQSFLKVHFIKPVVPAVPATA